MLPSVRCRCQWLRVYAPKVAFEGLPARQLFPIMLVYVPPGSQVHGPCSSSSSRCRAHQCQSKPFLPSPCFRWNSRLDKVVTCKPVKLEIPAHGKAEMKVEYVPRKINSNYRKKVTVVNCLNPHGNVDVEITGSNIDTHHVLYHSHFYKVRSSRACLVFFPRVELKKKGGE